MIKPVRGIHLTGLQVASLIKRWLPGTYQGSVELAHLPSRGLIVYRILELAIAHDQVRSRNLVAQPSAEDEATHAVWKTGEIRRAWTARERLDHGEPLTWASPVR